MEWVVVATSPHINCFCFFLNDLQVNLSVTGRYLLSCRENNLGKIWLIVVRVKWVAAVVVAPITAFHFPFVCFFLEDLLVNLSILRPFCFHAEIRNNLRKVWQIVGCQGNTRGVAKETVKNINRLAWRIWHRMTNHSRALESTSEGPIAKC